MKIFTNQKLQFENQEAFRRLSRLSEVRKILSENKKCPSFSKFLLIDLENFVKFDFLIGFAPFCCPRTFLNKGDKVFSFGDVGLLFRSMKIIFSVFSGLEKDGKFLAKSDNSTPKHSRPD